MPGPHAPDSAVSSDATHEPTDVVCSVDMAANLGTPRGECGRHVDTAVYDVAAGQLHCRALGRCIFTLCGDYSALRHFLGRRLTDPPRDYIATPV